MSAGPGAATTGDTTVGVGAAIRAAAARLADAGLPAPRTDAELLAAHVLGVTRGRLMLAPPLSADRHRQLQDLIEQRTSRVPVQHLTGRAGFRRLDLAVGPGVFVPRPETELLVEWGLASLGVERAEGAERVERAEGAEPPVIVDLCAGSGAIALSVAHEAPQSRVYAVEREPLALAWLRRNAEERVAAGDRPITVVEGDATASATTADLDGRVDLILCNPPYVPDDAALPEEVAEHDPAAALFGGPDGLSVVRSLLVRAMRLLRPYGLIGVEHADAQGESVPALLRRAGLGEVADHRDLAGRPRFATGRRSAGS